MSGKQFLGFVFVIGGVFIMIIGMVIIYGGSYEVQDRYYCECLYEWQLKHLELLNVTDHIFCGSGEYDFPKVRDGEMVLCYRGEVVP